MKLIILKSNAGSAGHGLRSIGNVEMVALVMV